MIEMSKKKDLKLWELATLYESLRGNMSERNVYEKKYEIIDIMQNAIKNGINGTEYKNRILGSQAWMVKEANDNDKLIPTNILNNVVTYKMAVMEVKV